MKTKKIIPALSLPENKVNDQLFKSTLEQIQALEINGADEVLIWDKNSISDYSEENLIGLLTHVSSRSDIPLIVYQVYRRFEDIKKIIYAGAARVLMNPLEGGGIETLKEGVARFDQENVIGTLLDITEEKLPSVSDFARIVDKSGCRTWLLDCLSQEKYASVIEEQKLQLLVMDDGDCGISSVVQEMKKTEVSAVVNFDCPTWDIMSLKRHMKQEGLEVSLFESSIPFNAFKLNSDGLIPVIVQDYKSAKVLMLAYMNEASYEETIRSGRMTYYSRSRQCLWKKGETSGHYQFVKALDIDCDNDTILAKVKQIGAACHTGNESCFYTNLVKKEYDDVNPATILQEIMATVLDRKEHPKEGSYTNYLFEKGIDKILKKVGEEATEIVIAAKNPDAGELKYEISDFLYHMIVLMAQRGVTWDEISRELAKRH